MTPPRPPAPDPNTETEAVEHVQEALAEALDEVATEREAEAAAEQLEIAAGDQTAEEALRSEPPKQEAAEAAEEIERAERAAPRDRRPAETLAAAARAIESTHGPAQEALAEAARATAAPEETGQLLPSEVVARRTLLRRALLRRLHFFEALDAEVFIWTNQLPRTRLTNHVFHALTTAFHGGAAWYVLAGAAMLARGRWDPDLWRNTVVPLTAASAVVEGPIKSYFKRRRPFIDLVRAIVIGKKPGTWSFPSGHSATGFAGAYLLGRAFPRLRPMFYGAAALVAFSRVYLGVHYPGDVVAGSVAGHVLAQCFAWLYPRARRVRRALRGLLDT